MAALATTPVVNSKKYSNPGPIIVACISVPLDGSYVAGGYAAFQAYVRTALSMPSFALLGLLQNECSGFLPVYDRTNDKLKIYSKGADPAAQTSAALTGGGAASLGTANGAMEDQNDAVATGGASADKASVDTRLVAIGNNTQELYDAVNKNTADITALYTQVDAVSNGRLAENAVGNLAAITLDIVVVGY